MLPLVRQYVTASIKESVRQTNRSAYSDEHLAVALYAVEVAATRKHLTPRHQFTVGNNLLVTMMARVGVALEGTDDAQRRKLAAVKHCNGHDTWVVAHQFNSDAFYSYLITDDGLNTTPLVQHVGKVHVPWVEGGPGAEGHTAIGNMKFSQQGDKLALASTWGTGFAQVFNFDAETGATL